MYQIIAPGGGGNTMMERTHAQGHTSPIEAARGRLSWREYPQHHKTHESGVEGNTGQRAAAEDLSQAKRGRLVVSRPLALLFLLCLCWPLLLRLVLWLIHVYQFFKYQRKRQAVILTHSTAPYSSLSASCSSSSSPKEVFFLNVSSSFSLARVNASALASP